MPSDSTALNPIISAAEKMNSTKAAPETSPVPKEKPLAEGETISKSETTIKKISNNTSIESKNTVSLDSAIDAINEGINQAAELSRRQVQSVETVSNISNKAKDIVVENIKDTQLIKKTEDVATLNAQKRASEFYKALGGDEMLISLAEGKVQAMEDFYAKQQKIADNVNLDFSDDPIQWIINKFTLPGLSQEASVAEATVAKLDESIKSITSLSKEVDSTLEELKVTSTEGTIAATQRQIARQAALDAARYAMDAEKSNAEKFNILMTASRDKVRYITDAYKLGHMARDEEEQREERELRRKALGKDEAFQETYVKGVIEGRRRIGVPIYEGSDPQLIEDQKNTILTQQKIGGESREETDRQFEVGIGTVSPTPFETARAVSVSDPAIMTDGTNKALTTLADSIYKVQEQAAGLDGIELTKENLPNLINSQFKNDMKEFEKEIKAGDETNPNKAVPLAAIVEAESVKAEPLVELVIKPLLSDEVKDYTPSKVVDLALKAIRTRSNPKGTITFQEAVEGITAIYQQAIAINNVTQKRVEFGLPIQQNFNAKLKDRVSPREPLLGFLPVGIRFSNTVDLSDETAVRNALVRALSPVSSTKDPSLQLDKFNKINRAQEK